MIGCFMRNGSEIHFNIFCNDVLVLVCISSFIKWLLMK